MEREQVPHLSQGKVHGHPLSSALRSRLLEFCHMTHLSAKSPKSDGLWLDQSLFHSGGRGKKIFWDNQQCLPHPPTTSETGRIKLIDHMGNYGSQCLNNLPVVIHLECENAQEPLPKFEVFILKPFFVKQIKPFIKTLSDKLFEPMLPW